MRAHDLSVWMVLCSAAAAPSARAQVRPGIEVLIADSSHLIRGRRLGLLSNQTGVDRRGRRDVDALIAAGFPVTALFGPEHGFVGREDRPGLPDATDSATGLPIYSLYGGSAAAAAAALGRIDVLLIDLQDVGARYYTYPATTASLLRAAARNHVRVLVLDRPDPIGGTLVQGDVRDSIGDPDREFVGFLPVPMRHAMTLGELARLANDQLGLHADLTVIPAQGWRRDMAYDSTGLPWIKPSPNLPDLESAFHYPGTCLFEGTNLSVGRGTPFAFQVIGAPWLDAGALLHELQRGMVNGEGLDGVAVDTVTFTPDHPTDGKFGGVAVHGLRIHVTDRTTYDPTHLAVALLVALRRVAPSAFAFGDRFDQLAAGPALRTAILSGRSPSAIWRGWAGALDRFRATRAKYLLY
jgi:uncharacterized protein YbbC (DUF1343 family)